MEKNPNGFHRKGVPDSPVETKPAKIEMPATPNVSGPAREPAGGDDPWDTPGFRLFKMLAFASYLISLLWAIIALLILYLRARIAQREQHTEPAINMDS